MKKISVIYRNRKNQEAISHLSENLERIFGEYIFIENYYLNELPENFQIIADAYLLADDSIIYPSKGHLPNFHNVVLMTRSLSNKNLQEIRDLPRGSNVLLVNDTYESAVRTVQALYAIDISHVNFIPYDAADINNFKYRDLTVCVTPNEPLLVPPHIKTVINIGYREISFDTIMNLKKTLKLDFDSTNRNLIRHIRSIAEPTNGFHDDYLSDCLKSQVLSSVMNKTDSAILIVNENYRLIYSNEKAYAFFHVENNDFVPLSEVVNEEFFSALKNSSPSDHFFAKDGERYYIEKNAVMLMDEVIGYCIYLQREKDLKEIQLQAQKKREQNGLFAKYTFSDIVHASPSMERCISLSKAAAMSSYAVLVTGESGVGKELVVQSLHNFSGRSTSAFVAVNCAALPESLLESELFGYEAGSFTGASKGGKVGLFEQANGGTIFLDEIGDTSPHLQSRLLRVLQEHQIVRIGSDRVIDVDIWIIAATNKNLREEVAAGNFRKDLFYRLNVFNINIDPLRNRREDILPLMSHFLGAKFKALTKREQEQLLLHDWPGNVRELESAAIHFSALSSLPAYLYEPPAAVSDASAASADASAASDALGAKSGQKSASMLRSEEIELEILKIIFENTHSFHGIGRAQLGNYLGAAHIKIGDSNLRAILKELQRRGLIEVGKGREGTRILEPGIREIQNRRQ